MTKSIEEENKAIRAKGAKWRATRKRIEELEEAHALKRELRGGL